MCRRYVLLIHLIKFFKNILKNKFEFFEFIFKSSTELNC